MRLTSIAKNTLFIVMTYKLKVNSTDSISYKSKNNTVIASEIVSKNIVL